MCFERRAVSVCLCPGCEKLASDFAATDHSPSLGCQGAPLPTVIVALERRSRCFCFCSLCERVREKKAIGQSFRVRVAAIALSQASVFTKDHICIGSLVFTVKGDFGSTDCIIESAVFFFLQILKNLSSCCRLEKPICIRKGLHFFF